MGIDKRIRRREVRRMMREGEQRRQRLIRAGIESDPTALVRAQLRIARWARQSLARPEVQS